MLGPSIRYSAKQNLVDIYFVYLLTIVLTGEQHQVVVEIGESRIKYLKSHRAGFLHGAAYCVLLF